METKPVVDVQEIFSALEKWIKQRPGLDPANYGLGVGQTFDRGQWKQAFAVYRSEVRQIGKDRKRAMDALETARSLQPVKPDILMDSFHAFSGRLTWIPNLDKCYMCGAVLREEERTWGKHSAYGTANRPVCSQACAIADHKDALDAHQLDYTTGQYFPTEYRKAAASVLECYIAGWRQWYSSEHPKEFVYTSVDDVRAANEEIGNHWFERSSMRFFRTRIESKLIGGKYFVTSEQFDDRSPRKFSVRRADPDGTVGTVGAFQGYATRGDAVSAIRDLMKEAA